jgi:hypothetical protein
LAAADAPGMTPWDEAAVTVPPLPVAAPTVLEVATGVMLGAVGATTATFLLLLLLLTMIWSFPTRLTAGLS